MNHNGWGMALAGGNPARVAQSPVPTPFKLSGGLTGEYNTISFQATNKPGWYLRVSSGNYMVLERADGATPGSTFAVAATFRVHRNKFHHHSFSFESVKMPGYYLSQDSRSRFMKVIRVSSSSQKRYASLRRLCWQGTYEY